MEEEELEFVEELEAVLQLTPEVQLAIEQVSVPPPRKRRAEDAVASGGSCGLCLGRWELGGEGRAKVWGRRRWGRVSHPGRGERPF